MIRRVIFWARWLRWFFGFPGYRYGDTTLDRESKNLIRQRYNEQEPCTACYGYGVVYIGGPACPECKGGTR